MSRMRVFVFTAFGLVAVCLSFVIPASAADRGYPGLHDIILDPDRFVVTIQDFDLSKFAVKSVAPRIVNERPSVEYMRIICRLSPEYELSLLTAGQSLRQHHRTYTVPA